MRNALSEDGRLPAGDSTAYRAGWQGGWPWSGGLAWPTHEVEASPGDGRMMPSRSMMVERCAVTRRRGGCHQRRERKVLPLGRRQSHSWLSEERLMVSGGGVVTREV